MNDRWAVSLALGLEICRTVTEAGIRLWVSSSLVLLAGFAGLAAVSALAKRQPSADTRCFVYKSLGMAVVLSLVLPPFVFAWIPHLPVSPLAKVSLPPLPLPPLAAGGEFSPRPPVLPSPPTPTRPAASVAQSGRSAPLPLSLPPLSPLSPPQSPSLPAERDLRFPPSALAFLYIAATLLWAGGTLYRWCDFVRVYAGLRRLNRVSTPLPVSHPANILLHRVASAAAAAAASRQIPPSKNLPSLVESDAVRSPFLLVTPGRAAIFLPRNGATEWSDGEWEAILSHELAHWRRGDCGWFLALHLLSALLWIQPLWHLLRRRFEDATEEACDEAVLRGGCGARVYAGLLVRLVENSFPPKQQRFEELLPGIIAPRSFLERRVRILMQTHHPSAGPPLSVARRIAVGAAVGTIAAGGFWIFGNPSPALFTQPAPSAASAPVVPLLQTPVEPPEPKFPQSDPKPEGRVTLQDISFHAEKDQQPAALFSSSLEFRYKDGQFTLHDTRAKKKVWGGPLADAVFTLKTHHEVHTLTDSQDRVLWSDADTTPRPDLRLDVLPDGTARLSDIMGTTLWTGELKQPAVFGGSSRVYKTPEGAVRETEAFGVTIKGVNDKIVVTGPDRTVLWTGTLPAKRTLLLTDGSRYVYRGPNRSAGSSNVVSRLRCTGQTGKVTITGLKGETIGSVPAEILTVRVEEKRKDGVFVPSSFPNRSQVHIPKLSVNGTIFLTYTDQTGRVIRRAKAYKNGGANGYDFHDGISSGSMSFSGLGSRPLPRT